MAQLPKVGRVLFEMTEEQAQTLERCVRVAALIQKHFPSAETQALGDLTELMEVFK